MTEDRALKEFIVSETLGTSLLVTALLRFMFESKRLDQADMAAIFASALALLESTAPSLPASVREKVVMALAAGANDFGVTVQ